MTFSKRLWIVMVLLGACARLAPHPWNFTPIMAIALFAGSHARKVSTGVLATLSALILSDLVLGFYSGFWYVYAAALIPVFLGRLIRTRQGVGTLIAAAFGSSLSFFLLTNFMVWALGPMYPHTVVGLSACYVAAIPFYQNQLLGDAAYVFAIFGGYSLIQRLWQHERQGAHLVGS